MQTPDPADGCAREPLPRLLTTAQCGDYLGFTANWVRDAIREGVDVGAGSRRVRLEAEVLTVNGRRIHRIHLEAFIAFCAAIGWQRLPVAAPAGVELN